MAVDSVVMAKAVWIRTQIKKKTGLHSGRTISPNQPQSHDFLRYLVNYSLAVPLLTIAVKKMVKNEEVSLIFIDYFLI